eukprot:615126-Prymnesium_polylepis.1
MSGWDRQKGAEGVKHTLSSLDSAPQGSGPGRANAATAVPSELQSEGRTEPMSRLLASREVHCRVSLRHTLESMAPLLQP